MKTMVAKMVAMCLLLMMSTTAAVEEFASQAGPRYLGRRTPYPFPSTPSLSSCCSTLPQTVTALRSQVAVLQGKVNQLEEQQPDDTQQPPSDLEARLAALEAKVAGLPAQANAPAVDLRARLDELQRLRVAFADLQVQFLRIVPVTAANDQMLGDDLLLLQDKVERLERQVAKIPNVPALEPANPQLAIDIANRTEVRRKALQRLQELKPQLP